jgi:hypothetical protein
MEGIAMKQAPNQTGRPVLEQKGYVATTLTAVHRQPAAATIVIDTGAGSVAAAPSGAASSGSSQQTLLQATQLPPTKG